MSGQDDSYGPSNRDRRAGSKNRSPYTEAGVPVSTRRPMTRVEGEERIRQFFRNAQSVRKGPGVSCPICGGVMVVRIRGRDSVAFLGCGAYPSCSGSCDIPASAQDEAVHWEHQVMSAEEARSRLPGSGTVASSPDAGHEGPVRYSEADAKAMKSLYDDPDLFTPENFTPKKEQSKPMHSHKDSPREDSDEARKVSYVPHEDTGEVENPGSRSIRSRLKKSLSISPYRSARMRALTHGTPMLLAVARKYFKSGAYDLFEAFITSDAGQGAFIGLIGLTGPLVPKLGQGKRAEALCDEFLDEGVAKGFNQALSLVAMLIGPVLQSALSEIPNVSELTEQVADKVVPKRRKKRIATSAAASPRVRSRAADDSGDSEDHAPLRAVRGL